MTIEKPFIHMLKTILCNYIYDVNTNQFIDIDEDTYRYLDDIEQGAGVLAPNDRVQRNIEELRTQGFLSTKHPQEIRHSHSDLLAYHLNENIMAMALQVTQQCNFRCAYCAYCADDFEFQRNHSSKRMSLETALAAVDFFAARCINQDQPTIGFYGGEPLLEFSLIQRVTAYAEEILYGKSLKFTITTNASLLTLDIARYLFEHNFIITISLDGTPETHDRSRRFANTGRGSFSVIRDKMDAIKEQYPGLYDKLSFNIVIDPRYPCDPLHQLFNQDDLFRKARFTSTLIDDTFTVEKAVPSEAFMQQDGRHAFKSYLSLRNLYDLDNVSRIAHTTLCSGIQRIHLNMKPAVSLPDVVAPGGPCITGERRLFVSVDGDLFPCERVSETSDVMKIGTLWNGFNMTKADRILNIAQTTAEDCKNCWAFRHCTLCCKHSDNSGKLSANLRRSQCDMVRTQVEDGFRDYLWMREFGVSYDTLG